MDPPIILFYTEQEWQLLRAALGDFPYCAALIWAISGILKWIWKYLFIYIIFFKDHILNIPLTYLCLKAYGPDAYHNFTIMKNVNNLSSQEKGFNKWYSASIL